MKKVLIVAADGLSKSGVPNVFMNIIRNLSSKGFVFDVAYFEKDYEYYENEIIKFGGKALFVDTLPEKNNKLNKLKNRFLLRKRFKKIFVQNGPYDIIHSFKGFDSGYILKAAKKQNIKIRLAHLCFIHTKPRKLFLKLLDRFEVKLTKRYCTNTIFDSDSTMKHNLNNFAKNRLIYNYYNENELIFKNLESQNADPQFVQIGSYCSNKNQLFSLAVLKEILKTYKNSKLHLIGFKNPDDDNYFNEILRFINKNKLMNNVEIHDSGVKQIDILKKCNYCLFPSVRESFGIVPIECQSVGLRCYCSDTVTSESNCGGCIYLEISNPKKWSMEIIEDFKKTSGVHKKYDMSRFSKENITDKYLSLYLGEK